MESVQLGATAAEIVTIRGKDVFLHADGRTEVYDLAYMRMLVPYLMGRRHAPPLKLVHFRPGMKPWVCLATIDADADATGGGDEPDLSGVTIYSGLGTHREMGVHLSRAEAWRMAEMLEPVTPDPGTAEPVPPAGAQGQPLRAAPGAAETLVPRPSAPDREQSGSAVQADG